MKLDFVAIIGLIIIVALAILTEGIILIPAFPFLILCLQRLGVAPK